MPCSGNRGQPSSNRRACLSVVAETKSFTDHRRLFDLETATPGRPIWRGLTRSGSSPVTPPDNLIVQHRAKLVQVQSRSTS
jgi:hypothetical protein